MFLLTGDGKYADVLERILYNGFLAGVSLTGDTFFYPNPLECDMHFQFNHGSLERQPWFGTSCCPTNVVRFMPSIAGYLYAVRDQDLYVNLYQDSEATIDVGGSEVRLTQQTAYPWDGTIHLTVAPEQPRRLRLLVRVPGWVRGEVMPGDLYRYEDPTPSDWSIRVNGTPAEADLESGYAVIDRRWQAGDEVEITFAMPIRRVLASEKVEANRGRVAIERGPLVYCAEGADQPDRKVLDRVLPDDTTLAAEHRPDLLGGVTVLTGQARRAARAEDGSVTTEPVPLTMIPYYAWCHRGANEMAVWLPRTIDGARIPPRPTIASRSRATASHCWERDRIDAVNDQVEPESSSDPGIPRLTWWDHRGTAEWVQYDFAEPTQVSAVAVYWFDDTGTGSCRVPASWRLLYRDGDAWKPVTTSEPFGVARDTYIRVPFEPVTTDALRVEVQLQPDFSGGILEWIVE